MLFSALQSLLFNRVLALREREVTVPPLTPPPPARPTLVVELPPRVQWLHALGFDHDAGAAMAADESRLRATLPGPRADEALAAVYLTHPHVDHTRGAPAVLRAFRVGVLVTNGQEEGSGACEQHEAERLAAASPDTRVVHVANPAAPLGRSDEWIDPVACSDVDPDLRVLFGRVDAGVAHAGWSATDLRNENEHSVVLRLQFGRFRALFTGDLEVQGILDLLAQSDPELLDVDLYHVGHHGSHNATNAALLTALSPVTAVISMGSPSREADFSAWRYGHPRAEVVALLAAGLTGRVEARTVQVATGPRAFESVRIEAAVYGTGWDGDVVIRAQADGTHSREQP